MCSSLLHGWETNIVTYYLCKHHTSNKHVGTELNFGNLSLHIHLSIKKSYKLTNIGIKHNFLCINICRALGEMLKPEPEGESVNISRGAR